MAGTKKEKAKSQEFTPITVNNKIVDEAVIFERIAAIIENRKYRIYAQTNHENTLMFWEIGRYINMVILGNKRAAYGKQILTTLSEKLVAKYGKSFTERNIYRMSQFADRFPNVEILSSLTTKLSWTHFIELLTLKSDEAWMFYAHNAAEQNYSIKELRRQISRKAFERHEIANSQLSRQSTVPFNVFKDPYLLDVLGLKDNYLEADLEKAVLKDIEAFILEFGHGFTFVERQKRMILDGEDIVLDLLFYHRNLKRLIAIELKLGRFKASYMGQMLLYLKWLDRYERQPGEEAPIGIILCATANREKIELLEMDKAGIAVAEYWTHLPPKAEFEAKIKEIMIEAKERLERQKSLVDGKIRKEIEFFIEPYDDDDD
ncbi:MAG: PDDEXK nuclease domain-containing protein [Treponema sp.]|nr:PDDEXK nuclease domain-containing protein [Treponema sp.]